MSTVRIDNVRLAFPALYSPKAFAGGEGSAKFGATFLIPKNDSDTIKKVKDIIVDVAKKKWGEKYKPILDSLVSQGRTFLRDGDDKVEYDGFADHFYVNASNAVRPIVIDAAKKPLSEESGLPYAGCYVNASIDVWAQDNKFGKRINASLRGVQFVRDGDAFSGSSPATPDEFDSLTSTASDSDGLF